jgi:class 3 adenylate cyclase
MPARETSQGPVVSLELLAKKSNGRWQSFGIYPAGDRLTALRAAKALERESGILAVRVIKETFDPTEHQVHAATLYRSRNLLLDDAEHWFPARPDGPVGGVEGPAGAHFAERLHHLLARLGRWLWRAPSNVRPTARRRFDKRRTPAADVAAVEPWSAGDGAGRLPLGHGDRRPQMRLVESFLRDSRHYLTKFNERGDTYNRFGLCFFIAGACEAIIKQSVLSHADSIALVTDCLSVMRLSPARARRFAERCERYLVESARYMHMFQAGHNAMVAFLREQVTSTSSLQAALKSWNQQRASGEDVDCRSLTLMFTDLVGHSELASERGDRFAMKVLRTHNQIVEAVLNQYDGYYVKHTGDGILAAFDDAATAVRAACVIQRCLLAHNTSFPDLPVRVRIGLNVGEAVAESGDVFGSAVNLAHRVCAAAGADQILCTGIVRRRVGGLALALVERGSHRIKGFRADIPLFELVWRSDAAAVGTVDAASVVAAEPAAAGDGEQVEGRIADGSDALTPGATLSAG